MYVILLLVLGVAASLAGLATVGFGVPIKEFSLGNTLIIAGTTALAAGLVLIGLALAVKQLQRIADALAPGLPSRPARLPQNADPAAARNNAGPPRIPFPPRPMPEAPGRAPEPRVPAPSADLSNDMPAERPRPQIPPVGRGEPTVVDDSEEVTLSPRAPGRPGAFPPRTSPDMPMEPARSNGSASANGLPGMDRPWPPGSAPAPQEPGGLFDSFWPARKAPAEQVEPRMSPAPVPDRRNETVAREDRKPEPQPQAPQTVVTERRAVAILKSGVVDGMAYTLYTDGSIEAELPEGTVRFGSIGELREHLEKHP
jgi:hypothetical protein